MRDSAVYLSEVLHRVPVHVVPCVLRRPEPDDRRRHCEHLRLDRPRGVELHARPALRGLGSVWTTLHLRNEQAAADLLGIPDGVSQVALIPVAYTIGDDFKPAQAPPVETVTLGHLGSYHG